MGRWGDGIYDRNDDYFADITKVLVQDAAYRFAPEQVKPRASWLIEALTLIEIMLIFSENEFISTIYLARQDTAIKRWQEIFLQIWDAEWSDRSEDVPYHTYSYRLEQRHMIIDMFNRLYELSEVWQFNAPQHDIQPFALEGKLPYFSLISLKDQDGREYLVTGTFLGRVIDRLIRKIVFILSQENREKDWIFGFSDLEELWTAIDMLSQLCERYDVSPGLKLATIQRWLDTTIGLWIDINSDNPDQIIDVQTLAEQEGELYTNVVTMFVRLMTLAQRHPGGILM
jgi:hypothetical protein